MLDVDPDAALPALAAAGQPAAFEQLMRRHNRLLFRTARSILGSDSEAEDVLQQAYLKAWLALPGFRAESKVSTWLVRIVVNEALQRRRTRPTSSTASRCTPAAWPVMPWRLTASGRATAPSSGGVPAAWPASTVRPPCAAPAWCGHPPRWTVSSPQRCACCPAAA
jgi:hypothetical protein